MPAGGGVAGPVTTNDAIHKTLLDILYEMRGGNKNTLRIKPFGLT